MPELAIAYAAGLLLNFVLVLSYFVRQKVAFSSKYRMLNFNLQKVGYRWSVEQGRLVALASADSSEELLASDETKTLQAILIFGGLVSFLSWVGLLILIIIYVSLKWLTRTKVEQELFASDLILRESEPAKVQELLRLLV